MHGNLAPEGVCGGSHQRARPGAYRGKQRDAFVLRKRKRRHQHDANAGTFIQEALDQRRSRHSAPVEWGYHDDTDVHSPYNSEHLEARLHQNEARARPEPIRQQRPFALMSQQRSENHRLRPSRSDLGTRRVTHWGRVHASHAIACQRAVLVDRLTLFQSCADVSRVHTLYGTR